MAALEVELEQVLRETDEGRQLLGPGGPEVVSLLWKVTPHGRHVDLVALKSLSVHEIAPDEVPFRKVWDDVHKKRVQPLGVP